MNGVVPNSAYRRKLSPLAVVVTAAALLLAHFAIAVGSKLHESTTSDELVHLTAGLSYWQHHDYRLQPENGILPQRWAALPLWIAGAKFPELPDNPYWRTSDVWHIGHQFFYRSGEDHFPRLMAGRAMIALFSCATGLLVFCWSRRLFGDAGALVSLGFYAFCPTFLAHGALVTSDMCMAFFFSRGHRRMVVVAARRACVRLVVVRVYSWSGLCREILGSAPSANDGAAGLHSRTGTRAPELRWQDFFYARRKIRRGHAFCHGPCDGRRPGYLGLLRFSLFRVQSPAARG